VADLETTGIDVATVGACQIAAVALIPGKDSGMVVRPLFQTYCKPSAKMTAEAEKIHGITPDKYRLSPPDSMAIWLLAQTISGLGPRPAILAGFNSNRYDYPIMRRLLPTFPDLPQLDAMHLAIRRDAGASYKLIDVFQQECSGVQGADWLLENAHDAMADCHMTAHVLAKFMADRGTVDARDLVEEMRTPKQLKLMAHGKHRGVPFNQVPASYLTWAAAEWTDMAPDLEFTFKCLGLR
jgi:DNA polymerase III epsilon subunit-like protein